MPEYCVIIAARNSSDRLPGKVLAELAPGVTVLGQLITRWFTSDRAPQVVVTTTIDPADDAIAAVADDAGVPCSRGSNTDVVAQMDLAVRTYAPRAKFVARALADNPLVDVGLADWRLDVLAETGADGLYYGNHERITYAATTDVWSRDAWDRIVAESSGSQLEHPGAVFWDRLSSFNVVQLPLPRREYLLPIRTELDTALDLEMFQAVWSAWERERVPAPEYIPTLWALKWLASHPDVARINSGVMVKTQTRALFPPREKGWLCPSCQGRMGGVKEGDLIVSCKSCGSSRKFYAAKPVRPRLGPRLGKGY